MNTQDKRERFFEKKANSLERMRPLCSDHRDKGSFYNCLLCLYEYEKKDHQITKDCIDHFQKRFEKLRDTWYNGTNDDVLKAVEMFVKGKDV